MIRLIEIEMDNEQVVDLLTTHGGPLSETPSDGGPTNWYLDTAYKTDSGKVVFGLRRYASE